VDPSLWIELVVFVVLLGFSGFFSSTETSLFSLSSFQLDQMRAARNPRIELIERLRSEPRRLIVTILIGNEFVNVSASVISAAMIIHLFGAENEMINLLVMVPILLLFGEITPKVLAIRNNVAFANVECRPIDLVARLITPLREVIRYIADFFITLIVGKTALTGQSGHRRHDPHAGT
jgi:putative hemolysin